MVEMLCISLHDSVYELEMIDNISLFIMFLDSTSKSSSSKRKRKTACAPSTPLQSSAAQSPPIEPPANKDNQDQCAECFYAPCIAQQNQGVGWLGSGANPCIGNSAIRRGLYKRFWTTICNTGGWSKPQYVAKKAAQTGRNNVVMIQRDIMPQCVLDLCRGKYPNPSGIPYMGHKWD